MHAQNVMSAVIPIAIRIIVVAALVAAISLCSPALVAAQGDLKVVRLALSF